MKTELHEGDCLEILRFIPDESINCIVTSPPYWGLRDYGHGGHDGFNSRWDAMTKEEQMSMGANARDVWSISPKGYKGAHFAVFPEALPERCILAGCPEGGVVLDPFAGSGTTLAVAHRLGRNSVGIELNSEYISLARARIAQVKR